jgi:membrane protease YdiL (CAAX protease family)
LLDDAAHYQAMPFTLRLAVAILIAAALAAVLAPFAALAVAAAGFHFPFPRIFDRTVMATTALMLWWWAGELRLGALLRRGFSRPMGQLGGALRGLIVAAVVIGILLGLAAVSGARTEPDAARALTQVPKYVAGAIAVAIIEEGFFRAFLLGGMLDDFGRTGALVLSSAIYALAHLVRAPGRFQLAHFDAAAGVHNLAASLEQLLHPAVALPALLGLFLLGLVLGEAFLLTGTIYFSAGLHAGLVIGAKLWPYGDAPAATAPPHWVAGYGHPALISGAAAWAMALAILALLPRLTGKRT